MHQLLRVAIACAVGGLLLACPPPAEASELTPNHLQQLLDLSEEGSSEAASSAEEPRRRDGGGRKIPGVLMLAGGPLFATAPLWRSVADPESRPDTPAYSLSIDLSVLLNVKRLSSLGLRVGYGQRVDRWASPDENPTRDLRATSSRTSFHARFKQRFWFRRVTPFVVVDAGVAIFVAEPRIGVAAQTAMKSPGLSLGLGCGLEFFPTPKVAILLEVRDDLTVRNVQRFQFYAVPDSDPEADPEILWDLELPRLWNTLTIQVGASFAL